MQKTFNGKNKKMEEQNAINNLSGEANQNLGNNYEPIVLASVVPETVQTPITASPVSENANQIKYAGFWVRFIACAIDGIILLLINIPITIIFYLASGNSFDATDRSSDMSLGFNFSSYIVTWAYYILMTDKYQATLGKKAMGIIVVDETLDKAPLGRIILRETVGKIISTIILFIGYIMAAFTNKKRSLHDLISGTVVIYKDSEISQSDKL
jgi:uncharacterized RDD family membrane protein YckC